MGVIFDGMVDIKELMEKIIVFILFNVKIYDVIVCIMNEIIYWFYFVDIYIVVVGFGFIFLSWLVNKLGIVYGNYVYLF